MTVKEVVVLAAGCLGREDLAAAAEKNQTQWTEEERSELNALLRAYNFVENEIALNFCPLKKEETVNVTANKIYYRGFANTPFNIRKIVCGGNLVRFATYSDYISIPDGWKGSAQVVYDYIPQAKESFGDLSEFTDTRVTAQVMAYGIAAQYCLVNGETGRAAQWERKFRDALQAYHLLRRTTRLRSRRWE